MAEQIFAPASAPNLREVVYERIKSAIIKGLIPAGAKLSEIELSHQFDVSRTPVREAIRQLAETGLVVLTARRGAFVFLPTAEGIQNLYEVRGALEAISVKHLCAAPPREYLIAARREFEAVSNDWDGAKFLEMDMEFHSEMSRRSHNSYLVDTLKRINDVASLCRHHAIGVHPKMRSAAEHISIIDAILDQDAELAQARMGIHIDNTRNALIEYVRAHPELTSVSQEEQ